MSRFPAEFMKLESSRRFLELMAADTLSFFVEEQGVVTKSRKIEFSTLKWNPQEAPVKQWFP